MHKFRLATHTTLAGGVAKQSLGHAGHGRREKLKHLPGDFVIHSDDDNYFLPDAFENYRKYAVDRCALCAGKYVPELCGAALHHAMLCEMCSG